MTISVGCPFRGTRKDRVAPVCEGCGARHERRTNGLGWVMIGSVFLLPLYGALRWMGPDVVAPLRWRQYA